MLFTNEPSLLLAFLKVCRLLPDLHSTTYHSSFCLSISRTTNYLHNRNNLTTAVCFRRQKKRIPADSIIRISRCSIVRRREQIMFFRIIESSVQRLNVGIVKHVYHYSCSKFEALREYLAFAGLL